jgi:type I restriction enzyme S subunit
MTGWREVKFGNILQEPVRNGIYKSKEFHGNGVKIVNMGELFAHPRLKDIPMRRVNLTENERSHNLLHNGDLIFARRSLTAEGAGKCSIVFNISEEVTFESSIIRARPDPTQAFSLFLFYYFNSPFGKYLLGTILRQVAVAGITGSDLSELLFLLPPLPEQKAIATVLSSFDDKIDLLHRQNVTLEAMAEALFRQLFVVEANEEWKEKTIGDVVEIRGGSTPKTTLPEYWDGDIYWTSPRDLSTLKSVFIFETERKITEAGLAQISSGLLPAGTLLLSSRAPIGYLAISCINIAINQGYIAILNNDYISNYYMYLWCKHYMEEIKAAANGSVFQEISKSIFRTLPFVLPPKNSLDSFNKIVVPIFEKLRTNQTQIRILEKLRDTLLPKLMSGAVRVEY